MAKRVAGDSVGGRILLLLGERYPITVKEVAIALGTREDSVRREIAKLQSGGLVITEDLDDKTYVTLTGAGITYVGLSPKDVARLKARKLPAARPRDDDDPAFR